MAEPVEQNEQSESTPNHAAPKVLLLILAAAIAGLWYGALEWKDRLPVKKIVVEGNRIIAEEEILRRARIPAHAVMKEIILSEIERSIGEHAYVEKVTVRKELPASLHITVDERQPAAAVALRGSGIIIFIDDSCIVLPQITTNLVFDVPVITGVDTAGGWKPGKKTGNQCAMLALEIIRESKRISNELYQLISEIQITKEGELIIVTSETGVPVLFGNGDVNVKLVKFHAFWNQCASSAVSQHPVRAVDVRFNDQVIVMNTPVQPV